MARKYNIYNKFLINIHVSKIKTKQALNNSVGKKYPTVY